MGVDLAQITFLGLTVQTWITVVIAAFGLMVSLLTFARGWRWRPKPRRSSPCSKATNSCARTSARPASTSDRRIPRELRRRQSFQRQSDRRELRCRTMGLPANRRNGSGQAKRVGHERLRKTAGADRRDHAILHHDRATAESSPGPVERSDEARAWSALGIISNPSPPVSIYAIPDLGHRTNEVRT